MFCSADDTQTILRKSGMKVTPQRLAIAELLLSEPVHMSARQVLDALRPDFPGLSQNTVYMTMASFEKAGLLRCIHANGRTVFDSNTDRHDHACCEDCGDIIDVPASKSPAPDITGWNIRSESRTWLGLCPACQTN